MSMCMLMTMFMILSISIYAIIIMRVSIALVTMTVGFSSSLIGVRAAVLEVHIRKGRSDMRSVIGAGARAR